MKQLLSLIGAVVAIVSLVVFGFTYRQVHEQQAALINDLQMRTSLLADSFKESIRPSYLNNATTTLQGVLDKFAGRERLLGLAVYDNQGNIFATSQELPIGLSDNPTLPEQAMDADSVMGDFLATSTERIYQFATPLHQDEKVIGALVVYQRAEYINENLRDIWKNNLLRLLIQALLFSIAVVLILRWIIYEPIVKMTESIRRTRIGSGGAGEEFISGSHGFFKPIAAEITKMSHSLVLARSAASEEARMRLEKLDSPWTAERLKEFIKAYLKDRKIFVVSFREPYSHYKTKEGTDYRMGIGGAVTALDPVMSACGGTWIGYGDGNADKQTADSEGKISVPPDEPKYTLKRVWLNEQEIKGHYVGFSNEALWPLCHLAHNRPIFRKEDWAQYRQVNNKFAQALLAEIKGVSRPIILVQDYHFSLLPQIIKHSRPDAEIGLFWHVPWPSAEGFSICPWRKEILEGMLSADVLGFHTQQYCNNFLETVGKEIESLTDLEKFAVTHNGHTAYIKPLPISVDFSGDNGRLAKAQLPKFLRELDPYPKYLGLGVDRLDYTKGILERLRGVEFFLDSNPSYLGRMVFLQIAPVSRAAVKKYQQFNEEVTQEAERINKKFERDNWRPIILIKEHLTHQQIEPLYRAANFCLITSLSDGMNLVAKEFVAARGDETGVLILSQFTGAARELKEALIVNPYSAEETAKAILAALDMPESEQKRRMKKMRDAVKNYNVYRWATEFLKAVTGLG